MLPTAGKVSVLTITGNDGNNSTCWALSHLHPLPLDFMLQDQGQCDLVMCLLGSFSHLLENEAAVASFRCIASHLRTGGLLVLELAHPGDLFDGTFIIG